MWETEQPNQNQNSFGPSNQSSTFSSPNQYQNQGVSGVNNQALAPSFTNPGMQVQNAVNNGWVNPGMQQSTGALPWQNNDTQSSVSNPSWNVGHEGTQNNMNRDQYRDAWMSSGVSNNQMMDQWLAQNGGQRLNDAGVVRTPYGEILDMGMAFKTGQGKPAWTDIGMNNLGPGQGLSAPSQSFQNQVPPGFQLASGSGMNINRPGLPPGMIPPPGLSYESQNPVSNYFNNMNPGQNQTMDISSLTGPTFQSGSLGNLAQQIKNAPPGLMNYQPSPEEIRMQDQRNIQAGAPGPGMVPNGWGGWITSEQAEQNRRNGLVS